MIGHRTVKAVVALMVLVFIATVLRYGLASPPASRRVWNPDVDIEAWPCPAFVDGQPRRCNPDSRRCRCLLELAAERDGGDATLAGVTETEERALCWAKDAGLATPKPLVRLALDGWLAKAHDAIGPYSCRRSRCEATHPREGPSSSAWESVDGALTALIGRDARPTTRPHAGFVDAVLFIESFVTYPFPLITPGFAETHDLYLSLKPRFAGAGRDLQINYLEYSEGALRTPPLPFERKVSAVAWFASNCLESRNAYVSALMEHFPVHAYGRCLRTHWSNITLPHCAVPRAGREFYTESECLMYHYKFYLSFEKETTDPFYVTEKFYQPLAMGAVPVYVGTSDVAARAPSPGSYIDAHDFASPAELGRFLTALAADRRRYERYLVWKTQPFAPSFAVVLAQSLSASVCRVCDYIADRLPVAMHEPPDSMP